MGKNTNEELNLFDFTDFDDLWIDSEDLFEGTNDNPSFSEDEISGKIIEAVSEMMKGDVSETFMNDLISALEGAYVEKYRHSYHMISSVIYQNLEKYDNSLDNLRNNVDFLLKVVADKSFDSKIYNGFKKLCDHIQLEIIRIDDNKSNIEEIKRLIDKFQENEKKSFEELSKNNEQMKADFATDIEEKTKSISNMTDEIIKEVNDVRNNMIGQVVGILGVFSAIVLAFTGGMIFSSSVLENIDKSSMYRILFVCIVIGFSFYNAIGIMVSYLEKIVFQVVKMEKCSEKDKTWIRDWRWAIVNIIFVAATIFIIFKWETSSEKAVMEKNNAYYIEVYEQNAESLKLKSVSDNTLEKSKESVEE